MTFNSVPNRWNKSSSYSLLLNPLSVYLFSRSSLVLKKVDFLFVKIDSRNMKKCKLCIVCLAYVNHVLIEERRLIALALSFHFPLVTGYKAIRVSIDGCRKQETCCPSKDILLCSPIYCADKYSLDMRPKKRERRRKNWLFSKKVVSLFSEQK